MSFSEMEELFARVGQRTVRTRAGYTPAVDVFHTDDPPLVTVTVDLAGVEPGDIELTFSEGVLSIAGLRRRPASGRAVYQQMELDYGPFERRVLVGEDVDSGAATAEYDRGLLTVRMPRVARREPPMRVVIAVVRQP